MLNFKNLLIFSTLIILLVGTLYVLTEHSSTGPVPNIELTQCEGNADVIKASLIGKKKSVVLEELGSYDAMKKNSCNVRVRKDGRPFNISGDSYWWLYSFSDEKAQDRTEAKLGLCIYKDFVISQTRMIHTDENGKHKVQQTEVTYPKLAEELLNGKQEEDLVAGPGQKL